MAEAIATMPRGKQKLLAVVDSTERLVGIVDRADRFQAPWPGERSSSLRAVGEVK